VVYSPGFTPDHPWFSVAEDADCVCLGELDLAAFFWRGPVLAVTGTNGKTTLTELLTHALGTAGRPALAVGNIGASFSRIAACVTDTNVTAVCEVSSYQAESLQVLNPDWTLWTNFAEDHLERHGDLRAYFRAKANLVARTPMGRSLVGTDVVETGRGLGISLEGVESVAGLPAEAGALAVGTPFAIGPQIQNLSLAAAWWRHQDLPDEALGKAAQTFRMGRHRLESVATVDGVAYWDDSKATNFHACEAALATIDGPVVWIGGGKSKGGDLAGFVSRISPRIRSAVLLGETGPELADLFAARGVPVQVASNLEDAVLHGRNRAQPGDAVVLSPGFSSLDQFDGYADRGEQFSGAVRKLLPPPVNCKNENVQSRV
jgi:UDP-N-acetylmuramoylalanine--D-glutamate ligase